MSIIQTYQTDWITSKPVFYNTKTKRAGAKMVDVIEWSDFEFNPEGLYNYLFFGYQVFDQTAVQHVKILRHSSILNQFLDERQNFQYSIEELNDPIEAYIGKRTTVDEAVEKLRDHVNSFEVESKKNHPGKRFMLPLSGGYDSRLLATLINEKSRIDAFTYDISLSEQYSFEVVRAQEVCRKLGIKWRKLLLNNYWNKAYAEKNFQAFCLEMPLHASYHMEMYDTIVREHGNNYVALSGSVGDWWSGQKVPLNVPKDHHNFNSLFFNHGISIPPEFIKVRTDHSIKRQEYENNIKRLNDDELFKIVFARRGRIGLATYIYRTAALYFDVYTPFYDLNIAMSQLNLPGDQRIGRKWLTNFFKENNLDIEHDKKKRIIASNDYGLDVKTAYYTLQKDDLLQLQYLKEIVDESRLIWINNQLSKIKSIPFPILTPISQKLFHIDSLANAMSAKTIFGSGFDYLYRTLYGMPDIFKAISEWTVLKPLEHALHKAHTFNIEST